MEGKGTPGGASPGGATRAPVSSDRTEPPPGPRPLLAEQPPRSVLAVCAHPDDESFGLGALLDHFAGRGVRVTLLCLTHGEASTLGGIEGDLGDQRRAELEAAAVELGVGRVELLDHPDGSLAAMPLDTLAGAVTSLAAEVGADLLLVFDEGGITGHPDHRRATEAALAGAPELPALAWTVPSGVADVLNTELGTSFVGRDEEEIDLVIPVDRARQLRAIARHVSQCGDDNPTLWRRLELLGGTEAVRWLRRPTPDPRRSPRPSAEQGPRQAVRPAS